MFVTLRDCTEILSRTFTALSEISGVQRHNTLDNTASIEVAGIAARKKNQFRVNGGEAAPPDPGGVK